MRKLFVRAAARKPARIKVSARERQLFIRRLALYLHAGIPLLEAITLLHESGSSRTHAHLTRGVLASLRNGLPLSSSLAAFARAYPASLTQLVASGERSGTLAATLARLASALDREAQLRRRILGALAYPACVLACTVALAGFLTFYLFPKVLPLFRGLHAALPLPTRMLVWLSHAVLAHWLLLACGSAAALSAGAYAHSLPRVRSRLHAATLRIPVLGSCVQNYCLAQVFRSLSVMLASGVRIVEALELSRSAVRSETYRASLARCEALVLSGSPLSAGLRAHGRAYPPFVQQLIGAGEQTGTLPESAAAVARMCEEMFDEQLRALTALLEPVLLLVMAAIVGFVALATIMPMYALTQALSVH